MANSWYKGDYYVDWHLHIIIVSKPSYATRNAIKAYIDKNWKDIENEHKVREFDLEDLGKKEVYKKKCNVKIADYFILQSEEVKFCHCNFSGEEDLKYSFIIMVSLFIKKLHDLISIKLCLDAQQS